MACRIMKYSLLVPLMVYAINEAAYSSPTTKTTESLEIIAEKFRIEQEQAHVSLCGKFWKNIFTGEILKRESFTSSNGIGIMNEILNNNNLKLRSVKNRRPKGSVVKLVDYVLHELMVTMFLDEDLVLGTPYGDLSEDKKRLYDYCRFLKVIIPRSDDKDFKCISDIVYSNIIDDFTKLGLRDDTLQKVVDSLDLVFKSLEVMSGSLLSYIGTKEEAILSKTKKRKMLLLCLIWHSI